MDKLKLFHITPFMQRIKRVLRCDWAGELYFPSCNPGRKRRRLAMMKQAFPCADLYVSHAHRLEHQESACVKGEEEESPCIKEEEESPYIKEEESVHIKGFRKYLGAEPESPGQKEDVERSQIKDEEPELCQQKHLSIKKEDEELPYVKEEEEEELITWSTGPDFARPSDSTPAFLLSFHALHRLSYPEQSDLPPPPYCLCSPIN
ncbi:uncharacterized protein LOC130927972 [Corythoichthys intestinalis]|uniref:uncharacterized protein LOC130927972 n=1 Tax=Corythoichthys intestinalis TaxID=161448 RepID=UPI0025A66CC7|nr:uncharacterized protein LOC130927972 [Corythoichthys intestinalis]